MNNLKAGLVLLAFAFAAMGLPTMAQADVVTGTIYYTTFAGGTNVHKVDFNYDGASTVTFSSNTGIAATAGADGIVFLKNGNLAIGGQGGSPTAPVHEITTSGTAVASFAAGSPGGAYHLSLAPDGGTLYAAGIPGGLGVMSLSGGGGLVAAGSTLTVSGAVSGVDSLAFVPLGGGGFKTYYTSSGAGGFGGFGTIDLTTGITTSIFSPIAAAHGMTYDPFTGDLFLYGDSHVTQIDPSTDSIVSDFMSPIGDLDQGTTDGKGHVFVACNCGDLLFIDMAATGLVGHASNFVDHHFLASALDDIVPLVGPGSNQAPEPGTLAILAAGLLAMGWARRRGQR